MDNKMNWTGEQTIIILVRVLREIDKPAIKASFPLFIFDALIELGWSFQWVSVPSKILKEECLLLLPDFYWDPTP